MIEKETKSLKSTKKSSQTPNGMRRSNVGSLAFSSRVRLPKKSAASRRSLMFSMTMLRSVTRSSTYKHSLKKRVPQKRTRLNDRKWATILIRSWTSCRSPNASGTLLTCNSPVFCSLNFWTKWETTSALLSSWKLSFQMSKKVKS